MRDLLSVMETIDQKKDKTGLYSMKLLEENYGDFTPTYDKYDSDSDSDSVSDYDSDSDFEKSIIEIMDDYEKIIIEI